MKAVCTVLAKKAAIICKLCCAGSLLLFGWAASAQSLNYVEHVDSLLSNYAQQFPATRLHLHLDKSTYTANETIWFSAYLYRVAPDSFQHQLLFVKLAREDNDTLIRSAIFPLFQTQASGQLLLPTSLLPGNYKLLAYTDEVRDGKPAVIFRQRLQIKTDAQPAFNFRIELVDSVKQQADSFRVRLKALRPNGHPLADAPFRAEVFAGNKRILKEKLSLDYKGELLLTLPRSPQQALSFKGQFDYEGEKEVIQLPVKQPIDRPHVAFFPEGGALVNNTTTKMAIEVTGPGGQPFVCDVELVQNEQLLSATQTNVYGIAQFEFPVSLQHRYALKLKTAAAEFTYPLPLIKPQGAVLRLQSGVVHDSINVFVQRKDLALPLRLLVHNFKDLSWAAEIRSMQDQLQLTIPTSDIPTGLYAVTLTNDALEPLAERLVFLHHQTDAVSLQTDKTVYNTKEKINLSVQVAPAFDSAFKQLSVSCAAINRISFEDYPDILTSFFIRDELTGSAGAALYFLRHQEDRLNDLLLTRGWRNYNWQFRDQPFRPLPPAVALNPGKGKVIAKQKGVYDLAVFGANGMFPYTTDSAGNYSLHYEHLLAPNDRPLFLVPVNRKSQKLTILPDTTFAGIDLRAVGIPLLEAPIGKPFFSANNSHVAPATGAKTMETVIVKTQKSSPTFKSRTCSDWVCQYNILNCENHRFGGVPQDGETYLYRERPGGQAVPVVYVGCQSMSMVTPKEFVAVPRISIAKEFYKPDYEKPAEAAPEYLTTLYWNPQLPMETNRFGDFFYSSGTKGVFFCTVQGLLNGVPVIATCQFEVK